MKLTVRVTKKIISETDYFSNRNCGLVVALREAGHSSHSAGGTYVDVDGENYRFLNRTDDKLSMQYLKKETGKNYSGVDVELIKTTS